MSKDCDEDEFDYVRGSGNVYRDFGDRDADVLQMKAVLAARIIGVLDDKKLTVTRAGKLTGFAAADYSRIRNADLKRFTVDRLTRMLTALDETLEVGVTVRPRTQAEDYASA